MTDERVDALLRRLDVPASPNPAFVVETAALLRPRARAARIQDTRWLGRARRNLRLAFATQARPLVPAPIGLLLVVGLLLLAVIAAAVAIAGAHNPILPIPNGPLVVSVAGDLRAIDVTSGTARSIGSPGQVALHVSRSPDGRLVAFWQPNPDGDQLMVMGLDGQGRLRLAADQAVTWAGCIDTWSPDSRYVASEILMNGSSQILVADSVTGTGWLVTPANVVAHCPLWSPDGRWIAFTQETVGGSRRLAIVKTDGTDMKGVSGNLGDFQVSGPDTWSPDGTWIYFDATQSATGHVYRANVLNSVSTQLSSDALHAFAPASSPDGSLVAFIVNRADAGFDLWVANSDGSHAHELLPHATNNGWSPDGRYVLTRWTPLDQPGGLAVISPDGSGLRVVAPLGQGCPSDTSQACDIGWGQPRP